MTAGSTGMTLSLPSSPMRTVGMGAAVHIPVTPSGGDGDGGPFTNKQWDDSTTWDDTSTWTD